MMEVLRFDEGLFGVFLEGIDGIVLTLRAEQDRLGRILLDIFQQPVKFGLGQLEQ